MTEDATPQPESPSPSAPANPNAVGPNAPRQKQSFRRRRKRRGSGGSPGRPGQAAVNNGQQANGVGAPAPQGNAPRNENQPRKKKRFFKKNQNQGQNQGANARGARGDSHGNSNGQQRRGGKQRRPKVFVGPMDHSYRAANGNYSDAPPSTIELQHGLTNAHYNGNGNGNFNAEYSGGANSGWSADDIQNPVNVAAMAEVAAATPARIYCFIDDLFFMAKIQETARKLGIKVSFVKNDKDTVADMLALPEEERPRLIVFDLNNANAKPLTLIPKLKAKLKRATSIVGFLSHLQGELKAKAIEAGCDTVMPRSAFSQSLPNLLRRYGIEVEIEDDQQPQILGA